MKKFFYQLLLFVFVSVVAYVAIVFLWGNYLPKSLNKNLRTQFRYGYLKERLTEADTTTNVDVLILGSSHAYRGYDTRIFEDNGLRAFNLGSSAQTPVQCELLVDHYLTKMNPKLVIIDIYPLTFGLDGAESTLDIILNENNLNSYELTMNALDTKNALVFNSLIYSSFPDFLKNSSSQKANNLGVYIKGGYVETFKSEVPQKKYTKFAYEILPKQMESFKRIVVNLKNKNIPYVLVQSPIRKDYYDAVTNNKEMDSLFASHGEYYNFNESLNISTNFFADNSHLNQLGVVIFNKSLMQKVKKLKNLK